MKKSIELPKQRLFIWKGINRLGEQTYGQVMAEKITDAQNQLRKQGIIVHSLQKRRSRLFSPHNRTINSHDVSVFTRQLSAMMKTGLSFVQALELIASSQINPHMQQLMITLQSDIMSGLTCAEALRRHPKQFNALICNVVAAGEETGTLGLMLAEITLHLEQAERTKQRIKKTLAYPLAVTLIASFVTAGLLICVIPQFESLFRSFGADLPLATLCVIRSSRFIQAHWLILSSVLYLHIAAFRHAHHHSSNFIRFLDKLLLSTPMIGRILQHMIIARFASALAITYSAGLPLVDGLKWVALATSHTLYAEGILRSRAVISQGERLHTALRQSGLFPEFVIHMVSLGEEAGTMDQMLRHVANYYQDGVDHTIHTLSSVLEPLIMALLGVLIGGLMIAMYFPILKLGSIV
ncbi:MAG: type II secretion system F family protein [Legionellaceae bacterium]|nr:type II secretion system F family protein [Legionellaceae bacterium]